MKKYPYRKAAGKPCKTTITGQAKPGCFKTKHCVQKPAGFYAYLLSKCTGNEKYLLLNYAQQGFANFKNTVVPAHLMRMGLLVAKDDEIKFFSASFRAYIIMQKNNANAEETTKQFSEESSWRAAKTILLVLVALFIFFTQEQAFQKNAGAAWRHWHHTYFFAAVHY